MEESIRSKLWKKPPSISPVEAFWISHIGEAPVRASRIAIDRSLSGSGVA